MSFKLTRQQRKALEFLRDDKEYGDLVYEPRFGWWLGDKRTNGKLALGLIRLCLITKEQMSNADKYERWEINQSGTRALEGKAPYCKANGTYTDNVGELFNG